MSQTTDRANKRKLLQLYDAKAAWRGLSNAQREAIGIAAVVYGIGRLGNSGEYSQAYVAAEYEGGVGIVEAVEHVLAQSKIPVVPNLEVLGVRQCHGCGCTDACGCEEGCGWAEPNLCTSCSAKRSEQSTAEDCPKR